MSLDDKIEKAKALLRKIETEFAPATFANSFGAEDVVLTDLIAKQSPGIAIFTLDTGRLPEETYRLMEKILDRYHVPIQPYFPQQQAVEKYVTKNGPNAFYDSIALRKECCNIRKVEPLKRALVGKRAWITGLRREQAPTRRDLQESEFDRDLGLQKFNPLLDWTESDVWDYIRRFDIPYNELHDKHYPSIGCAPCTRAIAQDEDIRAGRWWWENPETKECGLHAPKTKTA